ncbi:MAG: lytic murein transglycosylase, partial [Candidatus Marinimicrobia bacterium]|nr:lytic murein transglycosylase [Candidatus Neomarinimicrobiota bacterium]
MQFIVALLLVLASSTVLADRENKHGSAPASWSDQVEKDMVALIAKNEQARQIYTRVVKRLRRSGVPATYAWQVLSNPGIKIEPKISTRFSKPAEKMDYTDYRRIFVNTKRIAGGVKFSNKNKKLVHKV